MVLSILRIIFYAISTLYFLKLTNCFIPLKKNILIKVITYLLLILIVNVVIFSADIVNISFSMIGFVFIILICYEGNFLEKISIVMVLYPIIVALNFITNNIGTQIYLIFNKNTFIGSITDVISTGLCSISWISIYNISCKRIENSYRLIDKKTWILIDIICFAPFISIYSAVINTPINKEYQIYFTATACIVTNLGIIFLIEYMTKSVKTKIENQNLKLEYNYYKELEKNQLEIRKLRHDMRNHLSVIYSFLEDKNITDAKEYFASLWDKFRVSSRSFCKNSIVNAVLNSKYNFAVQSEIDCFFNIDINNHLPIDDIDLCSIFANTLDNAIEASQKIIFSSNRKITVKARCYKGYFSYRITNNYVSEINVSKERYLSNKPDGNLHGFGIENVTSIVKKYKGTFDITYTPTEFSVIVLIKIE